MQRPARAIDVAELTGRPGLTAQVDGLCAVAVNGLTRMLLTDSLQYPQTARRSADGGSLTLEGRNPRYAAMAALGLSRVGSAVQDGVLRGRPLKELVERTIQDALAGNDPGSVALAAWAAAETGTPAGPQLTDRLTDVLAGQVPVPTVDYSWALTAAVATADLPDRQRLMDVAARRLMGLQGGRGIFPHVLPPQVQGRFRAHVGCYADQVYPIQALARYHVVCGDDAALDAANRCAARIVELQGAQGQWWWHYDARTGDVVEGFPVYSVHQHAMGPMALLDLFEAGGRDLRTAVADGLAWIDHHPESSEPLVAESLGVVWRKIGRREPRKAVRKLRAVTTSLRPGLRFGVLDAAFPPGPVDHECRPYELGWLLYAWHGRGVVEQLMSGPFRASDADA
jgi:hypothetical protein